jgi:hypothetical protein
LVQKVAQVTVRYPYWYFYRQARCVFLTGDELSCSPAATKTINLALQSHLLMTHPASARRVSTVSA